LPRPPSPYCCDIAPQTLTGSLPLPTTKILLNTSQHAATRKKAADRSIEPAVAMFRVAAGESPSRFSTRERLKIRPICRTRRFQQVRFDQRHSTGIIELFGDLFRRARATKQISRAMKPFAALAQTSGNSPWLTTVNENGGRRRHPNPETVKCEPSASSLPLPSCLLAPRLPVRRMPLCLASEHLPIAARRSPLWRPKPLLLQPAET
jgi:hypothetical protein